MDPGTPGRAGTALAALGALLDRSIAQIADAAHDARTFDRETVRAVSDVWDNNTLPLFRAATGRSARERERRAREALEWMARLGPERRAWMAEQTAAAGYRIDVLARPVPARPDTPYRDYRGEVCPVPSRLTPQTAAELSEDYALDAATVRHLRIERAGARLGAFLTLELVRSYDAGESASPARPTLDVELEDLAGVDLDTCEGAGARLEPASSGVEIGLGARGVLRARSASSMIDDHSWHLSAAGRRADGTIPRRGERSRSGGPPGRGRLGSSAHGAAVFLIGAMMMIRSVRYPREAARVPLEAYCRALAGAGGDVLRVGALPARRRESAFRSLVAQWLRRGGTELAPDWRRLLGGMPDARDLARGVREELVAGGGVPHARVPAGEAVDLPEPVGLRMVSFTAGHTAWRTRHDASALVHVAVPSGEGAPWRLRALEAADPVRLRVRNGAFDGTGPLRVEDGGGGLRTLVTGEGALTLAARAWTRVPSAY
ncbi:hypothetical protein ACIRPH_15815 [Nocardiopsis sp. NPDC101807]|uniref:hypothetical protein n=1 Tax=Nocardiopsis sp. NPDC101807 TaxID=3364339 RepID=UPI00382512E6